MNLHSSNELYSITLKLRNFFFESNIAFHDDGTRFDPTEARLLSAHHKYMYSNYGIAPVEVTTDDRCEVVRQYILQEIEKLKSSFIADKR